MEDAEKEDAWHEIEARIDAAEEFDFVEEDFIIDKDTENSHSTDEIIPEDFKIAGIRIRGKGKMTKTLSTKS